MVQGVALPVDPDLERSPTDVQAAAARAEQDAAASAYEAQLEGAASTTARDAYLKDKFGQPGRKQ